MGVYRFSIVICFENLVHMTFGTVYMRVRYVMHRSSVDHSLRKISLRIDILYQTHFSVVLFF